MQYQYYLSGIAGVAGSVTSYLIGSWTPLFGFFLFLVALDFLSGLGAAAVEAKTGKGSGLSSKIGYIGLMKKGFTIAAIVLANQADKAMGTDFIFSGSLWAASALELISLVENYGRMNLKLPKPIMDVVAVLKSKGDNNESV